VRNGFTDAQCGFKAVRSDVARALVPLVEDDGWFFDTELLVLAEHNGMRIHEVPVDWVDDPDSRVDVRTTAIEDLRGIWRVVRSLARGGGTLPPGAVGPSATAVPALTGQLVRFAGIGAVSTVVFTVLYLLLAGPLGPVWADVVALAGCAVANLAANRRLTFAARGRSDRGRHYAAGLTLAALPLGLSLAALVVLGLAGVISTAAQLVALTSVNAFATLARFTLLRRWVFRDR
jgi:putative flippase GtrA